MSVQTRELIVNTHDMLKNGGPKTALNFLLSNENKLVKERIKKTNKLLNLMNEIIGEQ